MKKVDDKITQNAIFFYLLLASNLIGSIPLFADEHEIEWSDGSVVLAPGQPQEVELILTGSAPQTFSHLSARFYYDSSILDVEVIPKGIMVSNGCSSVSNELADDQNDDNDPTTDVLIATSPICQPPAPSQISSEIALLDLKITYVGFDDYRGTLNSLFEIGTRETQQPYREYTGKPLELLVFISDQDDDGIPDELDEFPNDPDENVDTDDDGVGNNADQDDDNDGFLDIEDDLPLDPSEHLDSDFDGDGNNSDKDDDNDGVLDEFDFYPLDPEKFEYCCQKALIVAGGGPYFGNALWPATKNMANFAYETLKFQGLEDEDIVYLSEEESDLVDGLPTKSRIRESILQLGDSEEEAIEHVLIYMVDHGGEGVFKLNESTLLQAQELGEWIDEMHSQFDGKSTLVYDACESGSFLPILASEGADNRLVLTSSAPKEAAVFALNGYSSYSYAFWSSFYVGFELHESHTLASRAVDLVWNQNAQVDADGDGMANAKADKLAIREFGFGQRAARASDNPVVGEIEVEQELFGETEVQLHVDEVIGGSRVKTVFAYVDDPDEYFSSPDEPVLTAARAELQENEDGSWSGLLTGLDILGSYEVTVIAENVNGLFSIPSESDTVKILQFKGRDPFIEESGEATEPQDTDGDGVVDVDDAFPSDASESMDTDGDGVGDNSDPFPSDASESKDTDLDEVGDNADNCPNLENTDQLNTDGDLEGDACDLDDDNDGFTDEEELADGTNPLSRFSCKSGCFSFDVDESLQAQPLTDGLLVIRHLFGFSGDALTSGAVSSDASRDASDVIASYLTDADSQLDIDGDSESKPLTDGLLLIRYLFGFSGDSLISGAIGEDAERDTAEEVETYIEERVPAQ